ncbi:MAG TPA: lamin tail domain-containing protein [Saprospiraceae bacterium]|nr:lamin tail domain-containing protein [Saprospiraceae bacterium]
MKAKLHLLMFIIIPMMMNAQIVISEIMYNPPESGTDIYEYIELYNNLDVEFDMTGYKMQGVEYVFNGEIIPANGYLVLAVNKAELDALFGTNSIQVTAGALNNSGETLAVLDAQDNVIDEVTYSRDAPWPSEANGNGSSLELCDPNSDNSLPESWTASLNATGKIVNGIEINASPGEQNCIIIYDAEITANPDNTFKPANVTIPLGGKVHWVNLGGNHNVNGSLTAYPNNPEGFMNGNPSSAAWTFDYTFTIPGVYEYRCDPHAGLGMTGTITVLNPYTNLGLDEVNATDVDGVCTRIGEKVIVQGVVNSINWRPGGLDFVISDDQNNGVFIFSNSESFGYTVTEGDEIEVKGTVTQFNGRTQVAPDEVLLVSSNNDLVIPDETNVFEEALEAHVLTIKNMTYVDAEQWKGTGSYNVSVTNGTDVFDIRIDSDTDLEGQPAPQAPFNITGVLSQYDSSSPYLEGYQLLIRYSSDIVPISKVNDLSSLGYIDVYPNPVLENLSFDTDIPNIEKVKLYDVNMNLVSEADFSKSLNVSELNAGIYFIQLIKGDYLTYKKFVKQ